MTIFTRVRSVCPTGLRKNAIKLRLSLVQQASNSVLHFSQAVCNTVISKYSLTLVFVLNVQIYMS
jgi:hypothetical protein